MSGRPDIPPPEGSDHDHLPAPLLVSATALGLTGLGLLVSSPAATVETADPATQQHVHVPVNLCGNTLGLGLPDQGNTCV